MTIERIEEFSINLTKQRAIQKLLSQSFAGYPSARIYYKQVPDFRYLVWQEDQLIGHLAVEHRIINNDGQIIPIFGVVDLCISDQFQNQHLASKLLHRLEQLGKDNQVEFVILLTNDPSFYQNCGYQPQNNLCQWVLIHAHQTMGATSRRLDYNLMIKPLADKTWLPGPVDFLGPLF